MFDFDDFDGDDLNDLCDIDWNNLDPDTLDPETLENLENRIVQLEQEQSENTWSLRRYGISPYWRI